MEPSRTPGGGAADKPPTPGGDSAAGKEPKKDSSMGWGRFFLYATGGISSVVFLYYFHKAKYSLHQTEILLLDRWRRLPLYWPPGPEEAERNTTLDGEGLPPDLVAAFAEWFVATDLQEAGGIVRDDILELFKELGFEEDQRPIKDFLQRGEGHLEEHRRLSGAGLQESLSLLAKLAVPEDGSPCKLGAEAVELLQRKLRRAASVLDGASALQRALQMGHPSTGGVYPPGMPGQSAAPPQPAEGGAAAPASALPAASSGASAPPPEEDVDEAQQNQLEAARLARIEDGLLSRLERMGSLSPAEEARLRDVREQRAKLRS